MSARRFSFTDLGRYMLVALAGYLAKVLGLVDLPSPWA